MHDVLRTRVNDFAIKLANVNGTGSASANSLIMQALGHPLPAAGAVAIAASTAAVLWNAVFNTLFERWEARQTQRGRSMLRRAVHAVLFEGGLTLLLVPVTFWVPATVRVFPLPTFNPTEVPLPAALKRPSTVSRSVFSLVPQVSLEPPTSGLVRFRLLV